MVTFFRFTRLVSPQRNRSVGFSGKLFILFSFNDVFTFCCSSHCLFSPPLWFILVMLLLRVSLCLSVYFNLHLSLSVSLSSQILEKTHKYVFTFIISIHKLPSSTGLTSCSCSCSSSSCTGLKFLDFGRSDFRPDPLN